MPSILWPLQDGPSNALEMDASASKERKRKQAAKQKLYDLQRVNLLRDIESEQGAALREAVQDKVAHSHDTCTPWKHCVVIAPCTCKRATGWLSMMGCCTDLPVVPTKEGSGGGQFPRIASRGGGRVQGHPDPGLAPTADDSEGDQA